MKNFNASASIFGWHFQINVAIFFMLNEIQNIDSVRVEGKDEDIEFNLKTGNKIFIQAKSKSDLGIDKKALEKFSEGLRTLIYASNNESYERLYFVTNYPNPIGGQQSHYYMFMGGNYIERQFLELPVSSTKRALKKIKEIEKSENLKFDIDNFRIAVMPFDGNIKLTRERIIESKLKDFLTSISMKESYARDILEIWQSDLFFNASDKDTNINLSKRQLMWPVISICCNLKESDKIVIDYEEELGLDKEEVELIISRYEDFINRQTERFDFATKVIGDFSVHRKSHNRREKNINYFVLKNWNSYVDAIFTDSMDAELLETLIKIILFKILNNKQVINEMITEVNL
ncbi:hypothetical protein [Enterococcus sp. FDAARGOS_375]|uniref:hypothetical protein n=1 Tax=Enterococcus sp. FDAARGOS_375 TaxID=2060307 RepID=UPI000BBD0F4B|nr:hypothetical protein [Enterococcus sp. FDAARGOS_375]ATF71511.1 hypothetical protein CO692_05060 [Enterococcus sp. FDAARGOS_375]